MRRRGRPGNRGIGTLLLVATGLLMAIPMVGAEGLLQSSAGPRVIPPSSLVASGASCTVGSRPEFAMYDPVNRDVYVSNTASGTLSILDGRCKRVATVHLPAGAYPGAAAYNPLNDRVYLPDFSLNQIYLLSGTKLVKTISSPTFKGPLGVAFDPVDAMMAVANHASNTVTFISGAKVMGTTTVGGNPFLFAYDPLYHRLLVTNSLTNNVTSLNAAHPTVEKDNINIPVGSVPIGIAFDYVNFEDYVANMGSNNVTVISGIGQQFGSVAVGANAWGVAWNWAKLSVYVSTSSPTTVAVIQGTTVVRTISAPSDSGFVAIAYDVATMRVFVTAVDADKVYVYR